MNAICNVCEGYTLVSIVLVKNYASKLIEILIITIAYNNCNYYYYSFKLYLWGKYLNQKKMFKENNKFELTTI